MKSDSQAGGFEHRQVIGAIPDRNRLFEAMPSLYQPFGFAGALSDPETGLYQRRGRYYDPTLGRYLSERGSAGEIEVNRYSGDMR